MEVTALSSLFAVVNLLASLFIFWLCLCKLNTTLSKRYLRIRFKYTVLLVGAIASGLQPILWSAYPNTGHCVLTVCIAVFLYTNKIHENIVNR